MIDIDELLQPAIEAFKQTAQDAIDEATEKMTNVLQVRYETEPGMNPDGCPLPRLQFRWEEHDRGYVCHYEFVFPLDELDIRCTDFNNSRFAVVELGRTKSSGGSWDWGAGLGRETPYRDGAHAKWDAPHFGNPPTYVIAPDGRFAERVEIRPV